MRDLVNVPDSSCADRCSWLQRRANDLALEVFHNGRSIHRWVDPEYGILAQRPGCIRMMPLELPRLAVAKS